MNNKNENMMARSFLKDTLSETRVEKDISIESIEPHRENPFALRDDKDMKELTESIKMQGLLEPILVWQPNPKKEKYVILSGHRRFHAVKSLQSETIRARICHCTAPEAKLVLIDSNFHRDNVLLSEKAHATKMRVDAITELRKKSRKDCGPSDHKYKGYRSIELAALESGDSPKQIQRLIKLTDLIPELMDLIDSRRIGRGAGEHLAYMSKADQQFLAEIISSEKLYPNMTQSKELKRLSQESDCSKDRVLSVLKTSASRKRRISLEMDAELIDKYFGPDATGQQIENKIMQLLQKEYNRQK